MPGNRICVFTYAGDGAATLVAETAKPPCWADAVIASITVSLTWASLSRSRSSGERLKGCGRFLIWAMMIPSLRPDWDSLITCSKVIPPTGGGRAWLCGSDDVGTNIKDMSRTINRHRPCMESTLVRMEH